VPKRSQADEPEVPVQVREWIGPALTSPDLVLYASKYSRGVNHSDVAPIEGLCSAIGLHLLIEPVTRPLASWNVVTLLLSVRAVPKSRSPVSVGATGDAACVGRFR